MKNEQLLCELVPSQAFGRNLRSILNTKTWSRISKSVRGSNEGKCVNCGDAAEHAHEVWEWVISEGHLLQRLVGIVPVCKKCHDFKHIGRILITKDQDAFHASIERAAKLNDLLAMTMLEHVELCFAAHNALKNIPLGAIDLDWLKHNHTLYTQAARTEISNYLSDEPNMVDESKETHAGEGD